MKKTIASFILACLAATAFAIEAKVVSITGKAEVQDGSVWTALKVGDTLKAGSVIQTGFKSEMVLNIKSPNEDTTITVSPLSRLTIEQLSEKGSQDKTSIHLAAGSLKSDIKKTADKRVGYQVRTPVATASVRGTVYSVTNTFRGVEIQNEDGGVACWRETAEKPIVKSDDYADVAEESGISKSSSTTVATSAKDLSFGAAPRGAMTVTKGQGGVIYQRGSASTPMSGFSRNSLSLVGTTKRIASNEVVNAVDVNSASSFMTASLLDSVIPGDMGGGAAIERGDISIVAGWGD